MLEQVLASVTSMAEQMATRERAVIAAMQRYSNAVLLGILAPAQVTSRQPIDASIRSRGSNTHMSCWQGPPWHGGECAHANQNSCCALAASPSLAIHVPVPVSPLLRVIVSS